MDYAVLRKQMVAEQLIARGITDKRVLAAFLKVERHKFVPSYSIERSYDDNPLDIGERQTISQPYMVALMTENLALEGKEKVLEIGTGSGYQAAILSELSKEVYSIERVESLGETAETRLKELKITNIRITIGDGTLGWPEFAPFDRIIVTAATQTVPQPLLDQLADGGKLILPLGQPFVQELTLIEKKQDKPEYRNICGCVFVPLIGKYGIKN